MNQKETNQVYNAASIDYAEEYVKAFAKIRKLEADLKKANLRANRLDLLLSQKTEALIKIRYIVAQTFEIK
jgi:hypothetical protein